MQTQYLPPEMDSMWWRIKQTYGVIRQWYSYGHGIIFVSKDDAAGKAVETVKGCIGGHCIDFRNKRIYKAEWDSAMRRLRDKGYRENVFAEQIDETLLLISQIERQPKWLYFAVKSLMERSKRPLVILASAQSVDSLPDYWSGHFAIIRKSGRPRRNTP